MSCNANSTKISRLAGLKAGISGLSSQVTGLAGTMAGRLEQKADTVTNAVGQAVAPVSNRVLQTIDRPTTLGANLLPALAGATVLAQVNVAATGPARGQRPAVAVAVGLRDLPEQRRRQVAFSRVKQGLAVAALVGGVVDSLAADATEQPETKRKLTQEKKSFLFGRRKVEVTLAKSKLTGWLNRRDRLVSRRHVRSNQGDLVRYNQTVWHRGVTELALPEGKRTITHVQKLGLPPASHYFERALSDEEVAALVSGQRQPHHLAGHVGTIGAMENLAPSWAQVKRSLILTRLHWPRGEKSPDQWVKQKANRETGKPRKIRTGSKPEPEKVGVR